MIKKVKENKPTTGALDRAMDFIAKKFNLGVGYQVTQFKEKPNNVEVTVNNPNFEVTVKFKDKSIIEELTLEEPEE